MMIDAKAQFALWADHPTQENVRDDVLMPFVVADWPKADLNDVSHRWRRYLARQSDYKSGYKLPSEFSEMMILKPPGTLEVSLPFGLSGLTNIIERFMQHDLTFFTDTSDRFLELVFFCFAGRKFVYDRHKDDDFSELQGLKRSTPVSRGMLLTSFASTVFYLPSGNTFRPPETTPVLYRGDVEHSAPNEELVGEERERVVMRLLLRHNSVKPTNPHSTPQKPEHLTPRRTDKLVFTIY